MAAVEKKLQLIESLIRDERAHEALAALNGFSPYRFSAVYAFDGDRLRTLLLVDRDGVLQATNEDVAVESTYCAFVRGADEPFVVTDSLIDDRVKGHPKRFVVRAYTGMPLMSRDGECIASLCCFDFTRVIAPRSVRTLMSRAAPLFADFADRQRPAAAALEARSEGASDGAPRPTAGTEDASPARIALLDRIRALDEQIDALSHERDALARRP